MCADIRALEGADRFIHVEAVMELLSAMTGTREYEEYIDRIDIPEGGISMCTVLESAL